MERSLFKDGGFGLLKSVIALNEVGLDKYKRLD